MIISVRTARSVSLGRVKLNEAGKVVEGDAVMGALVTDALRRVGGDMAALDGWTNGYVKLVERP